jgi:hypothetical protein
MILVVSDGRDSVSFGGILANDFIDPWDLQDRKSLERSGVARLLFGQVP